MTEYLQPGVYLEEGPAGHPIPGVPTSTTGLLGTEIIRKLQYYVMVDPKRLRDGDPHDPGVVMLELVAWLAERLAERAAPIAAEGLPHAARLEEAAALLKRRIADVTADPGSTPDARPDCP